LHGVGADEPVGQYEPAEQNVVGAVEMPVVAQKAPAVHGVGVARPTCAQKPPTAHGSATLLPAGQ
jgi:hypothetical protein